MTNRAIIGIVLEAAVIIVIILAAVAWCHGQTVKPALPSTAPVCTDDDAFVTKCKMTAPVVKSALPTKCSKGEYLSMDGRCLHDQTGESHPSGDGCNYMTCTDPACHYGVAASMDCLHGDDPPLAK